MHDVAQGLTVEQFGDGVSDAILIAEIVNRDDVGMGQCGDGARLPFETRDAIGIGAQGAGRSLIATSRRRLVSCARYTSPMPPEPIGAMTS